MAGILRRELFPLRYARRVYKRIVAPGEEKIVFELDRHLILNECVEEVLPRLIANLKKHSHPGENGERLDGPKDIP